MARTDSGHATTHSFVDLMTSLAVIFILLFLGKLAQISQAEDTAVEIVQNFDDQVNALLRDLKKQHLDVSLQPDPDDPFVRIVHLGSDTLFATEESELKDPKKRDALARLFSGLSERICPHREYFDSIIIEGHTDGQGDSTPQGKRFNFHLSVDRAFNVHSAGLANISGKADCITALTSLSGFGASRPKKTPLENALFADMPENRRVEIKIRFKPKPFMPESLVRKLSETDAK